MGIIIVKTLQSHSPRPPIAPLRGPTHTRPGNLDLFFMKNCGVRGLSSHCHHKRDGRTGVLAHQRTGDRRHESRRDARKTPRTPVDSKAGHWRNRGTRNYHHPQHPADSKQNCWSCKPWDRRRDCQTNPSNATRGAVTTFYTYPELTPISNVEMAPLIAATRRKFAGHRLPRFLGPLIGNAKVAA